MLLIFDFKNLVNFQTTLFTSILSKFDSKISAPEKSASEKLHFSILHLKSSASINEHLINWLFDRFEDWILLSLITKKKKSQVSYFTKYNNDVRHLKKEKCPKYKGTMEGKAYNFNNDRRIYFYCLFP